MKEFTWRCTVEELSSIKGLGPKTLESLKNININTIED